MTAVAPDSFVSLQPSRRVRTHRKRRGSGGRSQSDRPIESTKFGSFWDPSSDFGGRDVVSGRGVASARQRGRSKVLGKVLGAGLAVVLVLGVVGLIVPLPYIDQEAAKTIAKRVADAVACSGKAIPQPTVKVSGARLTSVVRRRLPRVDLAVQDLNLGIVKHAAVAATLNDVSQPRSNIVRAGGVTASVTLGFADLPIQQPNMQLAFSRSKEGQLTVGVKPTGSPDAGDAKLLASLEIKGNKVNVVPKEVTMFGKSFPAQQFAAQTGGNRSQDLPALPEGLAYKSISPAADGLHVAIGGTVTTAFSTMPSSVDGQPVTYRATPNGQMAISTSKDVPILGSVPITLYVAPQLGNGELNMVPQSVDVLGSNRDADDAIGKLVMDKVDRSSLNKKLPDLPAGVQYKSATIDPAGVKVVIDGTTVRSFSELPADVNGHKATYGAQGGLLTVKIQGSQDPNVAPIQLVAAPKIADGNLDLGVQQVQVLGASLPAGDMLSKLGNVKTSVPLAPLPEGLAYKGVDVLDSGMRVTVGGREVTLTSGGMSGGASGGSGGCHPAAAG